MTRAPDRGAVTGEGRRTNDFLGMMLSMLVAFDVGDLLRATGVPTYAGRVLGTIVVALVLTGAFVLVARRVGPYASGALWGVVAFETKSVALAATSADPWTALGDGRLHAAFVVGGTAVGIAQVWLILRFVRWSDRWRASSDGTAEDAR